ncbi:MAG: aspartate--tRNA ligase [Candidatus Nanoarchaeia archaeon]|nr:aspartate--tRNA ligase [Candidatus Nanoarchaeia archaeon]
MYYRTHNCSELRLDNVGQNVVLSGWIDKIRTHGQISFIDLRDRFGKTQLVLNLDDCDVSDDLKKEYVIRVEGIVAKKEVANENLETGEIEVKVSQLKIINKALALPIDENASDEMRLKYRYIDLRKKENMDKIVFRYNVIKHVREYFDKNGFIEIETPMLVKPTPEGARDYVVPSRVNPGKFYALPQSPQLYKQISMIAGADRYFQVARCLRDEDLRADRQPEHTQFDFEMSFVNSDEIREFAEGLMKSVVLKFKGIKVDDFKTFSYEEAMERYGCDKPDLRFDLELINFSEILKNTGFGVFDDAQTIYGLAVEKDFSRKEIDALTEVVKIYKAKGLAYVKVSDGNFDGGVSKFLNEDIKNKIIEKSKIKNGTIFFVADKKKVARTSMGELRNKIGLDLGLKDPDKFKFCWVKDFPLFSYNDEEEKWEPEHHMFSMPKEEFVEDFEKRPGEVLGDLWDLVLNGTELASGSIRITSPDLQKRIMKFVGFPEDEAMEKFGFLLNAYNYGAPVHGGMGLGADRIIALLLGTNDIREVIAYPKNKNAQCPMDGSPANIYKKQYEELFIKSTNNE